MIIAKIISKIRHYYYAFYKALISQAEQKYFATQENGISQIESIHAQIKLSGATVTPRIIYKLSSLKRLLEERRPKSILELGTGASTLVFMQYLQENKDARITCIDESEKWLANTKKLAEEAGMDCSGATFIRTDRVVVANPKPASVGYNYDFSTSKFDFVFVDGPSWHEKPYYNPDILLICRTTLPRTIVIDKRVETVRKLDEFIDHSQYTRILSDLYRFELTFGKRDGFSLFRSIPELWRLMKTIKPGYNYFSVFLTSPIEYATRPPSHIDGSLSDS